MCQLNVQHDLIWAQPSPTSRKIMVFKIKVWSSEYAVIMCFRVYMFSKTTSSNYWALCQQESSIWTKPQRCATMKNYLAVFSLLTFYEAVEPGLAVIHTALDYGNIIFAKCLLS